jgi:hypothetical protein
MWQALARHLGSNTTASPGEEGETIFIAETNDWRAIVVHEQGSNVEIEKVTEASHRGIKGRRLPRSIVFDSITDVSQALLRAKDAHAEFERGRTMICCMSRSFVVSHSALLLKRRRYSRGARRGEKLTMALSLQNGILCR